MHRIKELDYLRGLAAFSIMCYHFMKWMYVYKGAQSFIGRLGVYGVEIFYILSGITLFHVYQNQLTLKKQSILDYITKRFFRIFPLFWLCILLSIIVSLKHISFVNFIINITGIFSFTAWDKYIASGTWSIGNELVFYFLFPFLIFFHTKKPLLFALIGVLFAVVFHYFAFYVFNPNDTLHNQWANFVNPLNHLLLFYVGMLIPIFLQHHLLNKFWAILLIAIGAMILFLFPSGNDGIHLLFGMNRWIFTCGAVLIVTGFYNINLNLSGALNKLLQQLGEISYSVYLLHPIIFLLLCMAIRKLQTYYTFPTSNGLLIALAIALTLIVSSLVYKYFELYFIKKGRKIIANFYKS
jgi:peptidoglycan/LPS O-acetylase OafA/YrhL